MLHVTQSESPTCLCRELGWYRDDPRPFVGGEFFYCLRKTYIYGDKDNFEDVHRK